ncbi:TPA: hypothetical protein WJK54_000450 [Neisseria meningitidis]
MPERIMEFIQLIQLLANRLTVNRKWHAYLYCLPFTAYWVSADKEIVRTLVMGDGFFVLILCTALFGMWFFCRRQRWLWVLPYLCIFKILFSLI